MKLKRLNRKGFTLIELLAVIVILAIVMGIAATSVLTSINNSRSSSLYSVAQNAANTINTWVSEDMLITNNSNKHLGDTWIANSQTGNWICLGFDGTGTNKVGTIKQITNAGSATDLTSALSLNTTDFVFKPTGTYSAGSTTAEPGCSAIKYNKATGGYEIVLVAKNGGKYYVSSDKTHFAYSRANGANVVAE